MEFEQSTNNDKAIKRIGVSLVLVIVLMIGIIVAILLLQEPEKVFSIDGTNQNTKLEEVFYQEGNIVYVKIKKIAELLGYQTYNGDYKAYTEDINYCYIKNTNEIVSFELYSNKIYKTTPENDTEYTYFTLENEIKQINGELYIDLKGAMIACNCVIDYGDKGATIVSSDKLAIDYLIKYTNAQLEEFEDKKAILYGYIITKNEDDLCGVIDLEGNVTIGNKYVEMKFKESTQEFYVKTKEGYYGIIDVNGNTKIKPIYQEIKELDKDENLYIVRLNGKYGIIDEKGNNVLFAEYDSIGLKNPDSFDNENIKNPYLLYNTCIPVFKDGKAGLVSVDGKIILPLEYDDFGSTIIQETNLSNASGLLLLKKYKLIVVKKGEVYGLYNVKGKEIIPIALSSVYAVVENGNVTYKMTYSNTIMNVEEYIETYCLDIVDSTAIDIKTQNN